MYVPHRDDQLFLSCPCYHMTPTFCTLHMAAIQADANPSKASHMLISIFRCEGLTMLLPAQGTERNQTEVSVQRPYVHYCPPGRSVGHDTPVENGTRPDFNDAASWPLLRSAALDQALRVQALQVENLCLKLRCQPTVTPFPFRYVAAGASAFDACKRQIHACYQRAQTLHSRPQQDVGTDNHSFGVR